MSSHYIQVGKLNIDKDLLDIVCPAVGYTPELICPANGYVLEPGQDDYVPPIITPEPSNEEIVILCHNSGAKCYKAQCGVSGGKWYVEVYDGNGNYIETSAELSNGNHYSYDFPSGYEYFIFKLKIVGAYSFTYYKASQYSTAPWYGDYPILEAKFNTPNLTSLNAAFYNVIAIRKVTFVSTLDYLTSMQSMFYSGGMKIFTFPPSLPALTTVYGMFQANNTIEKIDMSGCNVPLLSSLYYFCYQSNSLYEVKLPASLPEATTLSSAFRDSSIKKLQMPISAPKVTNYSYLCYNAYYLTGEVIIPESQVCTTISSCFQNCYKVQKVIIQGNFLALAQSTNIFNACKSAIELEFPRNMGNASADYTTIYTCDSLIKVTLTDYTGASNGGMALLPNHKPKIEEFHGECDTPNDLGNDFNYPYPKVRIINCSKFKAYRLHIGSFSYPAPITTINIDFANSPWNDSNQPTISLYCNLDSTELNRILGLLPTVTGSHSIDIRNCPGFAGCDPSIAQSKGWTVHGA
jgi:hypothetical protein